jgi:hypothetical protein
VSGALSLWCVATRDVKLLFCVLALRKKVQSNFNVEKPVNRIRDSHKHVL